MNKKGQIIFLIVAIIIVLLLIFWYISMPEGKPKDYTKECRTQCEIKNLTFYHWSPKGYSPEVCNCQNNATKEIVVGYIK